MKELRGKKAGKELEVGLQDFFSRPRNVFRL